MVFGKCDDSLDTHLGKRKNLIFNIVRQMAKNHWILPAHSNFTNKVGLSLAGPPCNFWHVLLPALEGCEVLSWECLSVHLHISETTWLSFINLLWMIPKTGTVIRCALPVLWMTSCYNVMGLLVRYVYIQVARGQRSSRNYYIDFSLINFAKRWRPSYWGWSLLSRIGLEQSCRTSPKDSFSVA